LSSNNAKKKVQKKKHASKLETGYKRTMREKPTEKKRKREREYEPRKMGSRQRSAQQTSAGLCRPQATNGRRKGGKKVRS
jgi:hypothetical protein